MTTTLTLDPIAGFEGEVTIPGSKSISNRALLLAALSEGTTRLFNVLDADDIRHMIKALRALSVDVVQKNDCWEVKGLGSDGGWVAGGEHFLGNAGTAMRPLAAALALSGQGPFTLTGEPRMFERPIGPLVDSLRELGAQIEYLGEDGYPPLKIAARSESDQGLKTSIDGSLSSQFISALLMAAPLLKKAVQIQLVGELVSKPYIEITEGMMLDFGLKLEKPSDRTYVVKGGYRSPGDYLVEGDASSASYFLAAGAISGGPVKVHGVGKKSTQGDIEFCQVLEAMGAEIIMSDQWVEVRSSGRLKGVDLDLNKIPDAAMTLATVALFAEGPTVIRNVYNWRLKETDRLAAMATELQKVGAEVEEGHDFLKITPPVKIRPTAIDTYNDHRMAMCFALAAFGDSSITINDPGCTAKTFPDFFDRFEKLSKR